MHTLPRLVLICAIALGLLGIPAPSRARAAGPLIEEFDFVVDQEPAGNCGDFHIVADGTAEFASPPFSIATATLSALRFTGGIKAR